MLRYNDDPSPRVKLCFYSFDSPTEMTGAASPRHVLDRALDYLTSLYPDSGREHRERIDLLLAQDAA